MKLNILQYLGLKIGDWVIYITGKGDERVIAYATVEGPTVDKVPILIRQVLYQGLTPKVESEQEIMASQGDLHLRPRKIGGVLCKKCLGKGEVLDTDLKAGETGLVDCQACNGVGLEP